MSTNWSAWLLLTVIFAGLMLIIQRAERKRRLFTGLIMLLIGLVVRTYAIYRIGHDCPIRWDVLCRNNFVLQHSYEATALPVIGLAVVAAIVVNLLYWAFFGRYNPVGSSDSIKVIGRYDE